MIDNYALWAAKDAADELWRLSRPICASCDEHIQDEECYDTPRGLMDHDCARAYAEELAEEFVLDMLDEWRRSTDSYAT